MIKNLTISQTLKLVGKIQNKMPIYDFKCSKCKHEFEVSQRVSDPYPVECPKCKEKDVLEKIFTQAPGVEFKGKWFKSGGY